MRKLLKFLAGKRKNDNQPVVVIFAGGMGTQIIQAATYFELKRRGRTVYADLSYFERPQKLATVGNAGELTHWGWQLDWYGLQASGFDRCPEGLNKHNADLLGDGPRMTRIGLDAMSRTEIKERFAIPQAELSRLPAFVHEKYLCIHIRRGDYVNVASHLITDQEFLGLARKFAGLIDKVVILSDSPIEQSFKSEISKHFEKLEFLDNIDANASHCIMRLSKVLFCSNSSFSLTAAMLNSGGLVIIPRRWYDKDSSAVELPIHENNLFEIMETSLP